MPHRTDLPTALPVAIATALLVLILAPWLDDDEPGPCAETSVAAASVGDRSAESGC